MTRKIFRSILLVAGVVLAAGKVISTTFGEQERTPFVFVLTIRIRCSRHLKPSWLCATPRPSSMRWI